jgi:SAM-dependent methyltransferase
MYPYTFPEETFAKTLPQIEKLLSLTKPVGRTILDLACGPGRHSVALTQAGFLVTGVDKTKYLLEKARERAKTADVDVEWVQADMRNFTRAVAFDMIINMGVSFGYFDDKHDDLRVLSEWILIRKNRAKTFELRRTVYSGQEFKNRMEETGFVDMKLYGNLDGDEYRSESPRLIVVAHKGFSNNTEQGATANR